MNAGRIALACLLAAAAPMLGAGVDRSSAFEARVLAEHNRERARVGVPALAWDEKLAADAKGWADTLAASGRFEHSPADPRDPDVPGENLWAGTRGAYAPEEMVGLWVAEKTDYRPGTFPDVSKSGDLEKVGHYTQLIWRNTRKVGCALARGKKEDVLVCRYAEGGNVLGERVA